MSREVYVDGGINNFAGDITILELHGGVANISGRVGAVTQFGGVLNGRVFQQPPVKPTIKTEYRDRVVYKDRIVYRDRVVYKDRIVYRDREPQELSDQIWISKIARLENEHEAKAKALQAEIAELKERLQGALDAYHGLLHQQKQEPIPDRSWEYKPTRAECEAVYKNLKVWLECEQELEPINIY